MTRGPHAPSETAPTALILSGSGRYADPWHPFEETSAAIAGILEGRGFSVTIAPAVEPALAELAAEEAWPDLLVVNVGLPRDGRPSPELPAANSGLAVYTAGSRPLLVFHASSTSFVTSAVWTDAVGGFWNRGTSFHPDYGTSEVSVVTTASLWLKSTRDFTVDDEKYTSLSVSPKVVVAASHVYNGCTHPLVWLHEREQGRSVYDALGHDGASYASPGHVALINACLDWLLSPPGQRRATDTP